MNEKQIVEELVEDLARWFFWSAFPTGNWDIAVSQEYHREKAREWFRSHPSIRVAVDKDDNKSPGHLERVIKPSDYL